MPFYAHRVGGPWHPKPDFVRSGSQPWNVAPAMPETRNAIRDYLVDIGASAVAAANEIVDPAAAAEAYDDMAMRVHEDVTAQLYPLDVAILRQQYNEMGFRNFGYARSEDGSFEEITFS